MDTYPIIGSCFARIEEDGEEHIILTISWEAFIFSDCWLTDFCKDSVE
jgi:hypothetical protein